MKPIRVKSVQPPAPGSSTFGDLLIFGGGQVAAACFLQTDAAISLWQWWINICNGDSTIAFVVLLGVMPNLLVYYPYSIFYMVLDLWFPDHPWVKSKKIQPVRTKLFYCVLHSNSHPPNFLCQTSPRPSVRDYVEAFIVTGFNTLVVEPALLYAGYVSFYPAIGHCAWGQDQCMTKPSLIWSLLSLVVFSLVFEIGFYFSHFAMHQKPFYRLIHKTHHRFKSRE